MADIPINAIPRRVQFTGNTGLGPFAFTFNILAAADIAVYKNATLLTITTDYTVSLNANGTGSVTLTGAGSGTALVAADYLTIIGDLPLARTTDFTTAGDLLASALNDQLDASVVMTQQISERVDRALRQDPNDVDGDMTIPDKATRLGKYLRFNDTTGNPEAGDTAGLYTAAGMNHYNFTGDGATVNFTLGMEPGGENNTQVYIDGVYQQKDGYNVSGAVVQFSVAPPNLSTIEVMVIEVLPVGATTASQVSFTQAGSTYGRNVQLKLQESVSVKDFGAVGDGVADDTVAIQAACTANPGKTIFFPQGNYLVSSTIDLTGLRVRLLGEGAAFGSNRGTKLIFTAASGDMFNCDANYYMTVRNLGINGDPSITYATTNRCFVINNITHMLFENVNIEGFNDAIVQDLTSGINFHLTINQCNISDCYYALYIKKSCHLITITNSFFSNNGYGVRVENSDNVSFQSTAIQVQGMGLARGREATNSYNFRFDTCAAVGFDNCYFEVNAFDTVGSPVTPGTQYMGQINNCNGFNFKNSYVVGSTAMDAAVNLFQFTDTAGASFEGNYFYRFNSNMTLCSANATGSQNRHLINRASNVVNSTMKVIDNSYPPVLYLNNAEPTSPVPTYGAGNTGRTFFDGTNFRYVGTMIVTNWAALVAAGASSDYIGIKVPTAIDSASHGSLDQVAIGSGFWNGAGVLINAIEDTRPNIIRVKVNGWGTNLTSGDAPTYISFDVTYQPEILAT